jgi:DNA gyrase subunit A
VGRRYVRLNDGDKVVMVRVLADEEGLMLVSASGHVLHFAVEEVNILSGVGKGVMGIKLAEDDVCLGGALISNRHDALVVETAGGKTMEFRRGKYEPTSRGGKGYEAVKRTTFTRVVPPPIELVDWDKVEEKADEGGGKAGNGQRGLFE